MRLNHRLVAVGIIAVAIIALALWSKRFVESSIATTTGVVVPKKAGPSYIYPDPRRTPGSTNPDISQANIRETICRSNWTKAIRPPEAYTRKLKREQARDWGLPGPVSNYEEDHFIGLELGGNPTDPANLWPEAYSPRPGAREKDAVENYLRKQVCEGSLTLDQAQKAIVDDWYKVYLRIDGKQ